MVRTATSLVNAPRTRALADHLPEASAVLPAVPQVEDKSATSAAKSVTLPATAVAVVLPDMVSKAASATVPAMVLLVVARLATRAVVSATCPETAPRVKSATTVSVVLFSRAQRPLTDNQIQAARSVTCPAIAHPKLARNAFATSASSPDTSSLPAPTRAALRSSLARRQ